MALLSASAGESGDSGDVLIGSGVSTERPGIRHYGDPRTGDSGSIKMTTGDVLGHGRGGDISLKSGTSTHRDGGDIQINAGASQGMTYYGGNLHLASGYSTQKSGDIELVTPDSSIYGGTGAILIKSGDGKTDASGALKLETGHG